MADYSTIKGFTVQTLSSDPYATEVLGATWASGTDFPSTTVWGAGFGIQTAAVYGFGLDNPGAYVRTTFEYDGTSWAGPATVNRATGAACAGLGTQTAGLFAGGTTTPPNAVVTLTETYDGSSWSTSPGTLNTARTNPKGTGTTTAGIIFGGTTGLGSGPSQPAMDNTETWNGSAWTETNDMNTARNNPFSLGTTNPASTAVAAGGQTGATLITDAETWDGTSWSQVNDINTGRAAGGGASSSNTTGIIFGGKGPIPTANALTESWDGTSWTEVADLATARLVVVGTGTATSGFAIGGQTASAKIAGTEEFSAPAATVIAGEGQVWYNSSSQVLKGFGKQGTGAWASGGTMNAPYVYSAGYCGTQTAGVFAGGIPGDVTTTQTYNGSVWAASPATLNVGRHYIGSAGIGTLTAGMLFGGELASPPYNSNATEQFDGTSWTAVNNLITGRLGIAGAGTQAGALAMGGYSTTGLANVEDWDGTSWSAGTALPQAKYYTMGGGTYTSAIIAGGDPGSLNTSDEWNGTSWTETANINTGRNSGSRGAGSGTAALIFGGGAPPTNKKHTEQWDGSTWTTVADLANNAGSPAGNGTSMAAISCSGDPASGQTEEWTIPDATKTFTAS